MSNISEVNRELVRAFNINLCYNNIAITNLTVQNLHGKDHIVISFNKNTNLEHCVKYLNALKNKIIRRSHKDEKAASTSYNLESFPFNFSKVRSEKDDKGKRFLVEIDEGVIFNLKCYLAKALVGDVTEKLGKKRGPKYLKEHIHNVSFNRNSYLYCMRFYDKELQEDFVNSLLAQIRRYGNAPNDYLEENINLVYIKKSIFDDVEFIKDIEAYNASLICRDFQTPSIKDEVVANLKFPIIDFIRRMGIPVHSMIRASYKGSNENSVLIPVIDRSPIDGQEAGRFLNSNEIYKVNNEFDMEILSDVGRNISAKLPKSNSFDGIVYGINFSDLDVACCVMNKIMENSVINKNHELTIDPELFSRSLSQLPLTNMSDAELESPKRNQEEQIKESPRQPEKEKGTEVLCHTIDSGNLPQRSLSAAAVGAGKSVQEADIWLQQNNPWLSQDTHEDKWLQSPQPGPSGFLSQQRPSLWPQGGHSSRTSAWPQPMDPWSSPAPSGDIPGFWLPAQVDSRGKPLTEKEEELIKALLYAFNLNNYILKCPNTNFIVENGKIASSINDGVNVKEYLQELRDYTIKEYCGTEEEAKEAYDLNEFPFKFLSNCEKNQETTVVANISRGALFNLKKLFIQQKHEQRIGIEDININIIEKTVKSQKDRWVDSQVKGGDCGPKAAIKTCYPDESNLKHIPIIKDKGGYCLDRTYDTWEVESFMEERWRAKDTSKAEKTKPEDNKDSGYSSGFATDAESGFSEVQTEDEKAMSKPSEKQGKSNAVGAGESSRSGKFSKAKSEEDRVSSKSGSESPKKHGGGRFCKERSKSNSSSGSNTSSEPLEPSVPNTEDRSTIQKMLSFLPPSPFKRNSNKQGRESKVSSISTPEASVSEKTPDPKQHNTFPTRKGNLSSVPSPMRLKEGCSLEFSYLEHKLADGSTCIGIMEGDAVEGKRRILYDFIYHLPYSINKKTEREKVLESLSRPLYSHEEIEDLYLKFSSPDKREELCLNFCDGNKGKWESLWGQIHQSYGKGLFMLKIPEKLEQSSGLVRNKPGCRASIASKGSEASKDNAYFTGSPASQRSSTSNIFGSSHEDKPLRSFSSCTSFLSEPSTSGSVLHDTLGYNPDSSDEDEFSDKSLRYGSSVSGSSTSGSVLHGTSKCSSNSSDEDEFFRHPVERALSRINKSPTDSSISSNTSSKTVIKHDTENKGANSPSSQMDLIRLVSTKPKDKEQIDRILGFR